MAIETLLAIASFAISVGGFILVFFLKDRRKEAALAVVIALLVATTGVAIYQHYQHNQLINRVEKEIIAKLNGNTLTFDQLYQELYFVSFPLVNEALFRVVEKGVIRDRIIVVRVNDSMQQVRVYYVELPQ